MFYYFARSSRRAPFLATGRSPFATPVAYFDTAVPLPSRRVNKRRKSLACRTTCFLARVVNRRYGIFDGNITSRSEMSRDLVVNYDFIITPRPTVFFNSPGARSTVYADRLLRSFHGVCSILTVAAVVPLRYLRSIQLSLFKRRRTPPFAVFTRLTFSRTHSSFRLLRTRVFFLFKKNIVALR